MYLFVVRVCSLLVYVKIMVLYSMYMYWLIKKIVKIYICGILDISLSVWNIFVIFRSVRLILLMRLFMKYLMNLEK